MATPRTFTIEQTELLRRLRNSGISKEDIIQAFDSFDRLDQELGQVYNAPTHVNGHANNSPVLQRVTSPTTLGSPSIPNNSQNCLVRQKRSYSSAFGDGFMSGDVQFAVDVDDSSMNDELAEFLKSKPEEKLVGEVRSFASKLAIRQHQVANAAGISQSYVSRFFRGDFFEMSEASRHRIYKWYLRSRKSPETASTPINTLVASDALSRERYRRERFTFRPAHFAILEDSFGEDPYPSLERRQELADLCNKVGKQSCGRDMCAEVISNWFSNKRKEMKKQAMKEGIRVDSCRGRRSVYQVPDPTSPGGNMSNDSTSEHNSEESLAFAVEVAAVNEAIKSLSGQTGTATAIKVENSDTQGSET